MKTTFDDGGELIYTTLGPKPVGSQRKYIGLLRRRFGGRATPNAKWLRHVPGRLALVAGDHWPEWREALAAGLPYIVDEHDVVSLRTGAGHAEERAMLEGASAAIFTSEDHRDYLLELGVKLPPHEVIHLRPLAGDLDFRPLPKRPGKHLVYAGAIVEEALRAGPFGYRCYHRIFAAFIRAGWTVHVYTPMRGEPLLELRRLGVQVHPFVPHAELARETSQFTAGLHGYEHAGVPELAARYCDTCRPNKTWDYLAAGIPTICVNGGNSAKLLEAGGWGVALESLAPEQLARAEPDRLPRITEPMRAAQVIDADAERLYALVAAALERAPARALPAPEAPPRAPRPRFAGRAARPRPTPAPTRPPQPPLELPARFIRETGTRASLRVYWGEDCPNTYGAGSRGCHNAEIPIARSAKGRDFDLGGSVADHALELWPTRCDHCPAVRPEIEGSGGFTRQIFHRTTYGTASELPEPGDLFFSSWEHDDGREGWCEWANCSGPHLHAILPNGREWHVDGRANNCAKKEDRLHRCWVRHGRPEDGSIHVDKGGNTCEAGAGSIAAPGWHGYLDNGAFVLQRRP